jgi:hypothetical protein
MAVPNIFGTATSAIPLSQLDTNFATAITLGNTAVYLGNTTTSLGNVTLTNVTISSGNVTVTGANVSGTANVSTLVVTGNQTFVGTGNRITGDFSNATVANRVAFQSSTTNGNTNINAFPNGTGDTATINFFKNAADLANSSTASFGIGLGSGTEVRATSGITGTGTYLPMTFYTGGSERVRIDTSGNVGIGTSSIAGTATTRVEVNAASSAYNLSASGSLTGYLYADSSAFGLYGYANVPLIIKTNNTERMRIDSSGNLLVGTTSTYSSILGVYSTQNYVLGASTGYWKLAISSTNFFFAYGASGAPSDRASINSSTGVYTALSDRNKKKDFEDSNIGLSAVMQLKPTLFRMIEDDETKEKELGFIAQEVQSVIPQAYFEQNGSDGTKFIGLQDRPIIAVLTKAIQEQQALITALTARITALESN